MPEYSLITRIHRPMKKKKGKRIYGNQIETITGMRVRQGRHIEVVKAMDLHPEYIANWALESGLKGRKAIGRYVVEILEKEKGAIVSPNLKLNPELWPKRIPGGLRIVVWPELADIERFFWAASGVEAAGPSAFNRGAVITFGIDIWPRKSLKLEMCQYHYQLTGKIPLLRELHKKYGGARRAAFKRLLSMARELNIPTVHVTEGALTIRKKTDDPLHPQKFIFNETLKTEMINICAKIPGVRVVERKDGKELEIQLAVTPPQVKIKKGLLR